MMVLEMMIYLLQLYNIIINDDSKEMNTIIKKYIDDNGND